MNDVSSLIIHDPDELAELEPEWWQLWNDLDDTSPFQSPAWLIPWIREFAENKLRCVVSRRQGRIVALLPMMIDSSDKGPELVLCGTGTSDYLDGLFAETAMVSYAESALEFILDHASDIENIWFTNLKSHSTLLIASAPFNWIGRKVDDHEACPVLVLPSGGQLSDIVSKRVLKNLEYSRRRAKKLRKVHYVQANSENALALFDILVDLHQKRWSERGQAGVLEDPAIRRFHRAAIPRLMANGLLRLNVLYVDERPAAALYSLVAKDRWHYYIGGFDPDFAKLSVGTLIVGNAIEQALNEVCYAFDFLRGKEDYKYRWGAQDEHIFSKIMSRCVNRRNG